MCGIAGVVAADPSDRDGAQAEAMIRALAHRGPDGARVELFTGLALAHARLSIIDFEAGWQPLNAAGSSVIGNGEIYNYLELTEDFGLKNHLSTGSDFEPLLHLYAHEGERAFHRLRGMYAFFLNGVDGRRWLVRDPFGIKPLYVRSEPSRLLFASEPRAIWRALGVGPSTNPKQASELLTVNYVLDDGPDRQGIVRLAPGAVVEVVDGVPIPRSSISAIERSPAKITKRSPSSDLAALTELETVLEDAVRVHQRSDAPYGLFLSGGVDSTALAVLMARLNHRPVKAFTCGFDGTNVDDERRAAETVAKALDLDWRETNFSEEDFWRLAPACADALDDPTIDYACLPTLKLAEAAKAGVRVILSGEGGDEMFAGYGRYRRALRPRWLGGRPAEPQVSALKLRPLPANLKGSPTPMDVWRRQAQRSYVAEDCGSVLEQAQRADIATWLPKDLLLKLDRCLMAHGLEGRTPFLDRNVAKFAFSLPDHQKVRGGFGKWILRRWLQDACPASQPWAKKRGFTVPVGHWIRPRAANLARSVSACPGVAAICERDEVKAVFTEENRSDERWPLLFYALWWSIHVEDLSAAEASEAICGRS